MRALTRPVPSSFDRAIAARPPEPPIDVELARAQHAAYGEGLGWLGLEVEPLPADDALPDSCFVEDRAVVAAGIAIVTRSAVASRAREADAVAEALARRLEIAKMGAPATLDGGDCLRLGRRLYVGRSARTNDAGIASLRELLAPRGIDVIAVDAPGVLHLKCVCAPLGDDRVLVARGALPASTFAPARVVEIPAEEAYAANALAWGDRVLVSDGFPRAAEALAAHGFAVRPIPTSEFRKADGALTCLSILYQA